MSPQRRCIEVSKERIKAGKAPWPRYLRLEERSKFESEGTLPDLGEQSGVAVPATKPAGIEDDPRITKRRVVAKRSAANELARKILESTRAPSNPSDRDVESVLSLWAFRKNSDRKNVTLRINHGCTATLSAS